MSASYWQHPIKCVKCGLHFIVCSDYKNWPAEGTTELLHRKEDEVVPPHIFCPECGSIGPPGFNRLMLQYPAREVEGFIFQAVPSEPNRETLEQLNIKQEEEHGS